MNAIQRDGEIELLEDVNVGVAVALDEGLIVTTIRGAAGKDLDSIASEARLLATRAREGTASYDDVTGGTFTVTNLGAFQIDAFTPIINPPQVGILGVGRVVEKPRCPPGPDSCAVHDVPQPHLRPPGDRRGSRGPVPPGRQSIPGRPLVDGLYVGRWLVLRQLLRSVKVRNG